MYYDDLPVWGFIGKMEKTIKQSKAELRVFLFTHIDFDIKYNGDNVIEISVSTDPTQVGRVGRDSRACLAWHHVHGACVCGWISDHEYNRDNVIEISVSTDPTKVGRVGWECGQGVWASAAVHV